MVMSAEASSFEYTEVPLADVVVGKKRLVVEEVLKKILERDGKVEAAKVLDEARDVNSPLHEFFEWDNKIAGERWRLQQAYQLIMSCKYLIGVQEAEAPPTSLLGPASSSAREYVATLRGEGFVARKTMLSSDEMRAQFAKNRRAELRSWCAKVIDIPELQELRTLILLNLD